MKHYLITITTQDGLREYTQFSIIKSEPEQAKLEKAIHDYMMEFWGEKETIYKDDCYYNDEETASSVVDRYQEITEQQVEMLRELGIAYL